MRDLGRLTEQQRAAVQRLRGLVCVEAGAGAGKTSVITERYLHLVGEQEVPPSEILTVTFTRKAAQEMKRRIIGGLMGTGLEPLRRDVENAYIHTIDGFCERLLRENPFDAGVDPSFPMVEEGEAMRFRERAFEMAATDALAEGGGLADLVAEGSILPAAFGAGAEILGTLREHVKSALDKLRGYGFSVDDLEQWVLDEERQAAFANDRALQLVAVKVVEDLRPLLEGIGDPALASLWHTVSTTDTSDAKAWRGAVSEALSGVAQRRPAVGKELGKLPQLLSSCLKEMSLADDVREKEAAERAAALLRLTLNTWRCYEKLKEGEGQLDFSDLELRTVTLLEQCEPIRNRYQARFKHILIDEFQDVNPLQARLVRLLSSGDNVCFVGDPRQAIYGFRFGDVHQFQELSAEAVRRAQEEPESADHIPLDINFRSRPGILNFVAWIMERSNRPEFGRLVADRDAHDGPPVEIWLAAEERPSADAQTVARGIRDMIGDPNVLVEDGGSLRRARWGDVVVLCRTMTQADVYRKALAALGIRSHVAGAGKNYYARYEIRDMRNMLQALVRPSDDLALACLLRSPMVGLSLDAITILSMTPAPTDGRVEQEDKGLSLMERLSLGFPLPPEDAERLEMFTGWFPHLSQYVDRRPVGEVLECVFRSTDYAAKLLCRPEGAQQLANVRKLHQMAIDSDGLTISQFVRRLDRLEKIYQREGDAPTHDESSNIVRLMTVHGAKGLEFPIVVLAHTFWSRRSNEDICVIGPKDRRIGMRIGDFKSIPYQRVLEAHKEEEIAEEWRLLYVAMTRARDYLTLVLPVQTRGSGNRTSWAFGLRKALSIITDLPSGVRTLEDGVSYRVRQMGAMS